MVAEEGEEGGKKISITIRFPNREDMNLLCKPTTPFSKIYSAVAKAMGVDKGSFSLNWDEIKLRENENPKMHEFSDVGLLRITSWRKSKLSVGCVRNATKALREEEDEVVRGRKLIMEVPK